MYSVLKKEISFGAGLPCLHSGRSCVGGFKEEYIRRKATKCKEEKMKWMVLIVYPTSGSVTLDICRKKLETIL
jgi:hypothetical protein